METFERIIFTLESLVWSFPETVFGYNSLPLLVIVILGFGIFITARLGFIQIFQFKEAFKVLTGKYDDPKDKGDINHFQALSTALSATVGVGNIAGVALAIHIGGPGALFWMWVTAVFGMAIKYTECTLGAYYRTENKDGTVSGGPMYYIEKGLGSNWKWLAVLFAISGAICALLTGNAIQANTLADVMNSEFDIPLYITGLITASLVAAVILGGIKRIGAVTARLVPLMAILYVLGGLIILLLHYDQVIPGFVTILSNAFNPQAGVLGVGSGALIFTLSYGVQRGLFSNEAGQGSSPIAMSASKTKEPVQSGMVGLIGPFIDTLVVCTITGLVIVVTGAWDSYHKTTVNPTEGNIAYTIDISDMDSELPEENILIFENGVPVNGQMLRYNIPVDTMFVDTEYTVPFEGQIQLVNLRTDIEETAEVSELSFSSAGAVVTDQDGNILSRIYGGVVENVASLTSAAFAIGLAPLMPGGQYLVTIAVFFFVISTSISWSYYGERSIHYLFGEKSIFSYRMVFVAMHFLGAIVSVSVVWSFGDVMLGIMALTNIIGLIALSKVIYNITQTYLEKQKGKNQ
ncbi:MAG: sodium:alanine symporter family protein [Balneolaceae bacterium]|nr:sodium:alanine symporter family protein [Balneolaceae bacterium]